MKEITQKNAGHIKRYAESEKVNWKNDSLTNMTYSEEQIKIWKVFIT